MCDCACLLVGNSLNPPPLHERNKHTCSITYGYSFGCMYECAVFLINKVIELPHQQSQAISLYFICIQVNLENIGAEDIVDGNSRLILGLIWTIILRSPHTPGHNRVINISHAILYVVYMKVDWY